MRAQKCKRPGCGAWMLWVETAERRPTPIDATPNPAGRVVLEVATSSEGQLGARRARVLKKDEPAPAGAVLYMSHWATCKNPPARTRERSRPASSGPPHACAACGRTIPRQFALCRWHWSLLSPRLRDLVAIAWGGGHPSARYEAHRDEAVRESLAAEESRRLPQAEDEIL